MKNMTSKLLTTYKTGKNSLVLRPGSPPAKIDHFSIGVDKFQKDSVAADLKAR